MNRTFLYLALASILQGCTGVKTPFVFSGNDQGVLLLENGQPVLFFQREPKSGDSPYVCSNYIHPLFSLSGDTLTDEFPQDHPYHRGIFWAWHQVYIGDQSVGDGWIMKDLHQRVTGLDTAASDGSARLTTRVEWSSPLWKDDEPFVAEQAVITAHPLSGGIRKIDFDISLKALVPGVSIGGSDDEKGYGGFCARIRTPEDLVFTSDSGRVTPQNLQVVAGSWMDFSATYGPGHIDGIAILCHPSTPNYPAPWILRQSSSMQNIVFPGRERIALTLEKPLLLRYRLVVHGGSTENKDIRRLQAEYASE